MARSVRHLTETAALLAGRGIDLVVLKQGIDTTTPAGRFTFHVLAAMDEMLADLISEGTREGLESARARGRTGGRTPKLTTRQAEVARGMYDETGADGRRKYTVAEIAETFGVSAKPSTGTSTPPVAAASPARAGSRPRPPGRWPCCRTQSMPASANAPPEHGLAPLLRGPPWPARAAAANPSPGARRCSNARTSPSSGCTSTATTSPRPGTAWHASRTDPSSTSAAPAAATAP
jgi:Resolvase, N terminal domain